MAEPPGAGMWGRPVPYLTGGPNAMRWPDLTSFTEDLPPPEDCLGRRPHAVSTSTSYTIGQEDDMRRFWITMMTAAVVATAAGAAVAQGPPPAGPPERIAAALGLTDQQKAVWASAFS